MTAPLHRFVVAIVVAAALLNAGCATVFKGSTSSMRIAGLPEDAVVQTPDGIPLDRKSPLTKRARPTDSVLVSVTDPPRVVRILSGGAVTQVPAKRFVGAGWIVLGVLTGLVPLIVDAATGSWYEYADTSMDAARPIGSASTK